MGTLCRILEIFSSDGVVMWQYLEQCTKVLRVQTIRLLLLSVC